MYTYIHIYKYVCKFMCMHAPSLSHFQLFATPRTVAHQAPLSIAFFRQEHWSGLPFPSPDLPDPGIKPASPASPALVNGFFTTSATWEVCVYLNTYIYIKICAYSYIHISYCVLVWRTLV